MDEQEFAKLVREHFSSITGKRKLVAITVEFKDGGDIRVSLPPETFADLHGGLSERELPLLALLPDTDKPGINAKELKKKAGYRSLQYMRRVLRSMMSKGFVVKDDTGYRKAN